VHRSTGWDSLSLVDSTSHVAAGERCLDALVEDRSSVVAYVVAIAAS
jgi:hypothetical protein